MRENIPVRRSRPLPGVYPAISADGFVPVHGDFDVAARSGCDCNTRQSRSCDSCDSCDTCSTYQTASSCNDCDCGCDCNTRQSRSCDACDSCDTCGTYQTASSCNDCDCGCDCNTRQSRSCDACDSCDTCSTYQTASSCNDCGCNTCDSCQTAGMVYNADHSLCRRMNAADGIRHGTLFRELLKPFAACPNPTGCAEISDCQALAFAAWELRLYLNTHPDDCEALRLFEEYESKLRQENYATTFVPGRKGRSRWNWLDDPWPWETCANRGRS